MDFTVLRSFGFAVCFQLKSFLIIVVFKADHVSIVSLTGSGLLSGRCVLQ